MPHLLNLIHFEHFEIIHAAFRGTSSFGFILQSAKCVLVGDSGTGKSYLLSTYVRRAFPGDYHPDFLDSYSVELNINNSMAQLHLWDTAGSEEYDRVRPLCYPNTNVVIICFSIADPISFHNVTHTWLPDVNPYCSTTPILLVGTKRDLRENKEIVENLKEKKLSPITQQQGMDLAKQIGAVGYFECASIQMAGLDEIFEKAAQISLQGIKRPPPKKHCMIM